MNMTPMKRLIRNIHLWLSVPFGIVITLLCFSGAMLVFEPEVTAWVRPARPAAVQQAPAHHHGGAAAEKAASKVKGRGRHKDRLPFFHTMFRLHRWLLDGRPADGGIFWGKLVTGVSTLLFVGALVSGVVLWWPRTKQALKVRLKIECRHGWPRFWHSLHVAGGMYVLLFLLLMALTGLTWSFNWWREPVYALFGQEARRIIYTLHTGSWGGWLTRILYFIAALLGATLPITGYYLWIRRLMRRKAH